MDYNEEMKQKVEHKVKVFVTKGVKVLVFAVLAVAMLFLVGYVLMLLWNWLMPELFGLSVITYWQALGILVLAKIIFGFGSGNGPNKPSKKQHKRYRKHKNCAPLRRDFSEWKYYDEFWSTEGEAAFNEFVKRKKSGDEQAKKE